MPKVVIRDLELYYQAHGDPEGEPVVLLHGFLGTGESFTPIIDRLAKRFRLFIPDWRGHGRTNNPRGEVVHAELAADTAAFAAALGLERAHFCGHSSGGMHLLFLALQRPELVHSLTLVSATYVFDAALQTKVREARDHDAAGWIAGLTALHGDLHGPGYAEKLIDQWVEAVHRPGELTFTPDDLKRIQCPTLVLHGDRDRYFPLDVPETMAKAIPQAELVILPECGHLLPEEQPEKFGQVLSDFLGRNPMAAH